MPDRADQVVEIENASAAGPVLLVCEHASNRFPERWGDLGLSDAERRAHIAWDPGALPVAQHVSHLLDAPLVRSHVSRLIYDCNRAPDHPSAMAQTSETYQIAANCGLTDDQRLERTREIYLPFHAAVEEMIARMMSRGQRPVLVTIHSFTPVWHGVAREVELGIIHDADPALALAMLAQARQSTALDCRLNAPYSAADDVTHTLKLHANPYGLRNVMLEVRNDLIATAARQEAVALFLASVIAGAMAETDTMAAKGAA